MKKIVSVVMTAVLTATVGFSNTMAAEQGGYSAAGLGYDTISDTRISVSGLGANFGVGYNFNTYVGIEGEVAALNFIGSGNVSALPISINVLGYLPLTDRVGLFGKVGAAETLVAFTAPYGGAAASFSGQTTLYGAGIETTNSSEDTNYRLGYYHYDLGVAGMTLSSNYIGISGITHFKN